MSMEKEGVHIFVLETDEPHPETKARLGSYSDVLHTLFTEAGQEHDPPLKVDFSDHYVVDDPENGHHGHVPSVSDIPETVNGVLISGSMYDAHGEDKWILQLLGLLRDIWQQRPGIMFSGVCFGHQILSRLLGAHVEPHPAGRWELSHTEMNLTAVGQKLFRTSDKKLHLHQMHRDRVSSVPSIFTNDLLRGGQRVHVWASTQHTEIQGLYIRDRLFTSQGHLGFDEQMVQQEIEMREESGGIQNSERAEKAKEKAHMQHDGVVVASAILRFFYGEDHDID